MHAPVPFLREKMFSCMVQYGWVGVISPSPAAVNRPPTSCGDDPSGLAEGSGADVHWFLNVYTV